MIGALYMRRDCWWCSLSCIQGGAEKDVAFVFFMVVVHGGQENEWLLGYVAVCKIKEMMVG